MAVLTVCSSGCDYTTIASAISAGGATDIIEIQENIEECVSLDKNIQGIRGTSKSIVWNCNSDNDLIDIQNGLSQTFTIQDITLKHNGDYTKKVISWWQFTSGAKVYTINVDMYSEKTANASPIYEFSVVGETGCVLIQKCEVWGNGFASIGLYFSDNNTIANMVTIENTIVRDTENQGIYFNRSPASSNNHINIYHCILDDCGTGFYVEGRCTVTNCLFTNNTNDVNLASGSSGADFTYCAFETEVAGFGTGCIYGITSTDIYVDEAGNDFHYKNNSAVLDVGTNAGITEDKDGNNRPRLQFYDIGAYEKKPIRRAII